MGHMYSRAFCLALAGTPDTIRSGHVSAFMCYISSGSLQHARETAFDLTDYYLDGHFFEK